MRILESLQEHIDHIALIVVFTVIGMCIYATSSQEPIKTRIKHTTLGGLIALGLSYPTWQVVGYGHLWALMLITVIYTIAGQFIPEFLQGVLPKAAKKVTNVIFKRKFGEDLDNDN
mgnify:CR=1 FL=1